MHTRAAPTALAALALALACANPAPPADDPAPAPVPVAAPAPEPLPTDIPFYSPAPLSREELQDLSLRELSLRRNTIYARVGNPFNKTWLRAHFQHQPWYRPLEKPDLSRLTEVDRQNAALIADVEANLPKEELRERKAALLEEKGNLGEHFCCGEEIELQLVSAALGEWLGDPSVPRDQRNPLEDPTVLDGRLVPGQIADLSRRDLRLVRNTIFARHGRAFESDLLRDYFEQKIWYKVDRGYTDARLTELDKTNIALLLARENELGGPLTEDEHWREVSMMVAA